MDREKLKAYSAQADSVTDRALLWLVNLPAPLTFVAVVLVLAGAFVLGAKLS